jgi:hypothetical protein
MYSRTQRDRSIVRISGLLDIRQASFRLFFLLTYARRLKNRVSTAIVLQGCGRPAPRMNTNSGAQGNRSRKVGPITLSRKGLISPGQLSTLLPGDTARKRQKSRGIRADQDVRRRGQTRPPWQLVVAAFVFFACSILPLTRYLASPVFPPFRGCR